MRPESIGSSPLMQVRSVDLPDPEPPMIVTTSPFSTVRSMPFRTSSWPKDLRTCSVSIIGPPFFQIAAEPRQRERNDKVEGAADQQQKHRFLQPCDQDLGGLQKLGHLHDIDQG